MFEIQFTAPNHTDTFVISPITDNTPYALVKRIKFNNNKGEVLILHCTVGNTSSVMGERKKITVIDILVTGNQRIITLKCGLRVVKLIRNINEHFRYFVKIIVPYVFLLE